MDSRTREVLEIDVVLEHLARRAACSLGGDYVRTLAPMPDRGAMEQRLAVVGDLMRLVSENLTVPLGGLFDATELLNRAAIEGTALDLEEWPRLGRFLDVCSNVADFREAHGARYEGLRRVTMGLEPNNDLRHAINRTFEPSGEIRDTASPELNAIRRNIAACEQRLQKTVARLAADFHARGLLQDNFSTMRNGRHVLPVRPGSRSRIPGILHGGSASGETVYVEPLEVLEASNEVESLHEAEAREIHRILLALTAALRPWIRLGLGNVRILRELDGLYAMARTGAEFGWSTVAPRDGAAMRLFNAHHPLLQLAGGGRKSVPITILLERDDRCVVLSGPNAGGKTTAMKALGLLAHMAHCGCPIPVFPDSTIPMLDNVLADIGDSQSIQEGVSTFSGHLRNIRAVWEAAGRRSLVLLDELGTGTDPQEGGALALALLEGLHKRALLTITTSHLNPVKVWAEDTAGVRNASFSLDATTREPTFRLRLDLPGASEALEIAEKEHLPASVLARARELVGARQLEMGELLRRIERKERELTEALKQAEARAKALGEQEQLARLRADQLRAERREMKEQGLKERERELASLRERIEKMVSELPSEDELARRRDALARTRAAALKERDRLAGERRLMGVPDSAELSDLRVGHQVFVLSLRQWGEITKIDAEGKKAKVIVGNLEAMVKAEDLRDHDPAERQLAARDEQNVLESELSGKTYGTGKRGRRMRAAQQASLPPAPVKKPGGVTLGGRSFVRADRPTSMMLDLHGFRVEEALSALDKFLDQGLLASYPYVKVNHGIGSGRLYKAVHEYLRGHPSVKNFRFATSDEGGGGVTIVTL